MDSVKSETREQIMELAGRMYESCDILRAIQTRQYTSLDELERVLEQRTSHLSNELEKNC